MRDGGDALVGQQMEPFLRVGSEESDLQVELGVVEKEVCGEWIHALTAEEDEIVTAVHGGVDGGVGVGAVAPPDCAFGVPQGESELGIALKVGPVYGDLSGIGNRRSGQNPREQKQSNNRPNIFHNRIGFYKTYVDIVPLQGKIMTWFGCRSSPVREDKDETGMSRMVRFGFRMHPSSLSLRARQGVAIQSGSLCGMPRRCGSCPMVLLDCRVGALPLLAMTKVWSGGRGGVVPLDCRVAVLLAMTTQKTRGM